MPLKGGCAAGQSCLLPGMDGEGLRRGDDVRRGDIVCDAPAGRLEGTAAFRDFMEPFTKIVTRAELIAAFGDDRTALLTHDTDTAPVRHAPGAECHGVDNGKITRITIIFDRHRSPKRAQRPARDESASFAPLNSSRERSACERWGGLCDGARLLRLLPNS
jgi:hypothetical protein